MSSDTVSVEVVDEDDEFTALQVAGFLARKGKRVKYLGPLLKKWNHRIAEVLSEVLDEGGIELTERGDVQFPECVPSEPFDFLHAKEDLSLSDFVFSAGDIVKGYPKLGELAMRMGKHVARVIKGRKTSFRPVIINVIKLTKGRAIYIKTDTPWGGKELVVKLSRFRYITKEFLERYYIITNAKMGFLEKF
ncbi:MAG: hypothetical protein ACP5HQ_06405 [Thermoprotei archaeon]